MMLLLFDFRCYCSCCRYSLLILNIFCCILNVKWNRKYRKAAEKKITTQKLSGAGNLIEFSCIIKKKLVVHRQLMWIRRGGLVKFSVSLLYSNLQKEQNNNNNNSSSIIMSIVGCDHLGPTCVWSFKSKNLFFAVCASICVLSLANVTVSLANFSPTALLYSLLLLLPCVLISFDIYRWPMFKRRFLYILIFISWYCWF